MPGAKKEEKKYLAIHQKKKQIQNVSQLSLNGFLNRSLRKKHCQSMEQFDFSFNIKDKSPKKSGTGLNRSYNRKLSDAETRITAQSAQSPKISLSPIEKQKKKNSSDKQEETKQNSFSPSKKEIVTICKTLEAHNRSNKFQGGYFSTHHHTRSREANKADRSHQRQNSKDSNKSITKPNNIEKKNYIPNSTHHLEEYYRSTKNIFSKTLICDIGKESKEINIIPNIEIAESILNTTPKIKDQFDKKFSKATGRTAKVIKETILLVNLKGTREKRK